MFAAALSPSYAIHAEPVPQERIKEQSNETAPRGSLPGESILTFGVRQGVGFVTLSAHALSDRQTSQLVRHLVDLARRVGGNLALDATLVRPFNCNWINSLIELHHKCRNMGGQLVVSGLPQEAMDIIVSTGLTKRITVTSSRESAMQVFVDARSGGGVLSWFKRRAA